MTEVDRLLIEVIDRMALRFESQAVLRGGMVLRVLGCERLTNDVDYVMVPFRSKKDVVEDVLETLGGLEGVRLTHSLNSKCLRVILRRNQTVAQVEIKVDKHVPTYIVSTKGITDLLGLPPRLIPVLDFSVALADKMAAWNERRLVRDIYDIWFFLGMGVTVDEERLSNRIQKPMYSRLVKPSRQLMERTVPAFYALLQKEVNELTDTDVRESLSDLLPEEELVGLVMRFKAQFQKVFMR